MQGNRRPEQEVKLYLLHGERARAAPGQHLDRLPMQHIPTVVGPQFLALRAQCAPPWWRLLFDTAEPPAIELPEVPALPTPEEQAQSVHAAPPFEVGSLLPPVPTLPTPEEREKTRGTLTPEAPRLRKVTKEMLRRVFVCGNAGYFHREVATESWGARKRCLKLMLSQGLLRTSATKEHPPRLLWHLTAAGAQLAREQWCPSEHNGQCVTTACACVNQSCSCRS